MNAHFEPTQGCHQRKQRATVVRETRTQYIVLMNDETRERRIRKSNMLHVSPWDRSFPDYRLVITK